MPPDLVILYEHPEWQKPLFAALERRGIRFQPFDLKQAAFSNVEAPAAPLYFNQASPSAYVRGHTRAVPLALAYMRTLERRGARVLNGADVFALELSKSAQATLLHTLGIDTPRSITFNDVAALGARANEVGWPALLKPDQGGSGARIHVVASVEEVDRILAADPSLWLPDNLFLLQEYLDHDPEAGIVRLEFLGGELLYAMRVKTHGRFNLCPSPVCNPEDGEGQCEVPAHPASAAAPVEFYPFPEVPNDRGRDRLADRPGSAPGRRRHRIPGHDGWQARLLRHQRQLESPAVSGRGVWVRSLRARRRLPSARTAANRRERGAHRFVVVGRHFQPMAVRIGKVDRVRLLMIDDRVGVDRAALIILQLQRGEPLEERGKSARIDRKRDAIKAGGFPRALRLAGEQRELRRTAVARDHQRTARIL